MKFGRILRETLEGAVPRLVAVQPEQERVIDLASAEYRRLLATGASGELIGSGTVGGGCGVELGKLLKPGDVVELEIEGIGVLRNKMGTPPPAGWMPERRVPSAE